MTEEADQEIRDVQGVSAYFAVTRIPSRIQTNPAIARQFVMRGVEEHTARPISEVA